jgi:hypothetical protein
LRAHASRQRAHACVKLWQRVRRVSAPAWRDGGVGAGRQKRFDCLWRVVSHRVRQRREPCGVARGVRGAGAQQAAHEGAVAGAGSKQQRRRVAAVGSLNPRAARQQRLRAAALRRQRHHVQRCEACERVRPAHAPRERQCNQPLR